MAAASSRRKHINAKKRRKANKNQRSQQHLSRGGNSAGRRESMASRTYQSWRQLINETRCLCINGAAASSNIKITTACLACGAPAAGISGWLPRTLAGWQRWTPRRGNMAANAAAKRARLRLRLQRLLLCCCAAAETGGKRLKITLEAKRENHCAAKQSSRRK